MPHFPVSLPHHQLSAHDHQILRYLADSEYELASIAVNYDAAIADLKGVKPDDDAYTIHWSDYICGIKMERENVKEVARMVNSLSTRVKCGEVSSSYAFHCGQQYRTYLENFKYERWSTLAGRVNTAVQYYRSLVPPPEPLAEGEGSSPSSKAGGASSAKKTEADPIPIKSPTKAEAEKPSKEASDARKPSSTSSASSWCSRRRRLTKTTRFAT